MMYMRISYDYTSSTFYCCVAKMVAYLRCHDQQVYACLYIYIQQMILLGKLLVQHCLSAGQSDDVLGGNHNATELLRLYIPSQSGLTYLLTANSFVRV